MIEGKITRISGPIVYAEGLDGCGLYDVVDVGDAKLIGEIIRQKEGIATIQVYEDDTGMHVGEKVSCQERPLSVRLGPGLVGTIYDGIQRPLASIFGESGAFLLPGQRTEPLDAAKKWDFAPVLKAQDQIYPGAVIGTVQETSSILHSIMVPPDTRGRLLAKISPAGAYTIDDVIAETELGEKIYLSQYWPVRRARPYTAKLTVSEPLVTGQRVIDVFFPLSRGG
ncbi:MAG TPA: V-type ATP synthase subunit A, partial [Candidatus Treponema faecavium]|nr:V-type ATP synthase subunit A [Candidatus Treponema faecavium]